MAFLPTGTVSMTPPVDEEEAAAGDEPQYDYDLVVIGGGSGGLACSKAAADLGKRVCVLDFVKPSPQGSSWGLGGTCVNVGCIPKKLMHQASVIGKHIKDAKSFGWQLPEDPVVNSWEGLVSGVQDHIGSLNWGYRVSLRDKNVTYLNAYGTFQDAHTLMTVNRRNKEKVITAEKFVVATGGRPSFPDIPGAKEFGISSDDVFSLAASPGKTLVIGASYVALECAGFLTSLGLDTTVMVRSIFLRGFDQDCANRIGDYMESQGTQFIRSATPSKLEKNEAGKIVVTYTYEGAEATAEYDTVLFAIGRYACTKGIGLEELGVKLNPRNGKILHDQFEQTSVDNIYAIGDVLDDKPELTPVAIQAGKLLSHRLYGGATRTTDYVNIPTTVYTPLEYGCCGLSEEAAIEQYGEDSVEVYLQLFTPLEWTVPARDENKAYVKVITNLKDDERVLGFHYLGPNAGEVTQGFGIALQLGATKASFDRLIGIHPTCAEVFTTLEVTRRSGANIESTGC